MARVLIWGDSQGGMPGAQAEAALEANSHVVTRVFNQNISPIVQSRDGSSYWNQYKQLARNADVILLIFGHNDRAGTAHGAALTKFRRDVDPPVLMSGPPLYAIPEDRAQGDALRAQNAQIFGSRFIDAYPSTPLSIPRASPTNPHFTMAGAATWGRAMADAVEHFLANPDAAPAPSGGGGGGTVLGPPVSHGRLALAAAGAVTVLGLLWWLSRRPVRRNRRRRR